MAITDIFSFSGFLIGEVLKEDAQTRELSVFIPKLMPALQKTTAISEAPTVKNNKIYPNIQYNNTIRTTGAFKVKASDKQAKLPKAGSRVLIIFFEGDPRRGYWFPFNPNNETEVVETEKFDSLYTLTVNDKSSKLMTEDTVRFEFENKDVVFYETEGRKIFSVRDKKDANSDLEIVKSDLSSVKTSLSNFEKSMLKQANSSFIIENGVAEENFISKTGDAVIAKLVLSSVNDGLKITIPAGFVPGKINLKISSILYRSSGYPTISESFITEGSKFVINGPSITGINDFFVVPEGQSGKLVIEGSWKI